MNHHQTALFLVYRIILRKNRTLQKITNRKRKNHHPKTRMKIIRFQRVQKMFSLKKVNALYERLLQEMESKSKKLNDDQKIIGTVPNGRDY